MTESGSDKQRFDERTLRELTQLADGTLSDRKRRALEARVDDSPELAAALERQRVAIAATRELELEAPAGLRARIEAERSRRPTAPVRRPRLSIAGGVPAAAAAAVVLAILVLPSDSTAPNVVETAQLAERSATQASVPVDPENPTVLATASDGVPFPNLAEEFGWSEAGARSDELDGRQTKTVFYERDGRRIGYTIIAGEAIPWPKGARRTTLNEVELRTISEGPHQIVTWRRGGRTCVLSGEEVSADELLALASWKGEGSVPF